MSHAAFLSAIRAAPDDDTPRLVYADYLDERGDAARAEFVRVQCELAGLSPTDERRPGLEDREHELLAANEPKWLGVPNTHIGEWHFHRGFVRDVSSAADTTPRTIFDAHPVTTWSPHWHRWDDFNEENEDWLAGGNVPDASAILEMIRELDLSADGNHILADYPPLLHTDEPGRLESLDFSHLRGLPALPHLIAGLPFVLQLKGLTAGGAVMAALHAGVASERIDGPALAAALAEAPLERLGLFDCGLTPAGLRALLAPTLRILDISGNPIPGGAAAAFRDAPAGLALDRLDISGTELAVEALGLVLATPPCRTLTALEINHCDGGRRNIATLAASPFWSQAKELRARVGTVSPVGLDLLCRPGGPANLGVLDLSDNHLGDRGVEMIAAAPWAASLHWLSLSRNDLSDRAVRALAECGRFRNLRTLHLAHNARVRGGITDAGVAALAESPSLAGLRVLTLNDTAISPTGLDRALNAPYWRLSALGVGACLLGPAAVRVLAKSPRLARLNWLDLSYNLELGGRELMPLAESPYLSPLCELDLGAVDVDDAVAAVLRERLRPRLSL